MNIKDIPVKSYRRTCDWRRAPPGRWRQVTVKERILRLKVILLEKANVKRSACPVPWAWTAEHTRGTRPCDAWKQYGTREITIAKTALSPAQR